MPRAFPGPAASRPVAGRAAARPLRWLAVPMAGASTGVLVSQFHLIGVHPPFLAGVLIVVIAVVLCLAEMINPRRVPRGVAAGLTYTVVAGLVVWWWDSARADLWYVAESGVILGLGVFLATRVREPRTLRRVLPGVVLTLAAVIAGAIATALQAVAARDVGSAAARSWRR